MGMSKINKGSCNHYVKSSRVARGFNFKNIDLDVLIEDISEKVSSYVMRELDINGFLKFKGLEDLLMAKGKSKKKSSKKC
jgi:hypothetical protein